MASSCGHGTFTSIASPLDQMQLIERMVVGPRLNAQLLAIKSHPMPESVSSKRDSKGRNGEEVRYRDQKQKRRWW